MIERDASDLHITAGERRRSSASTATSSSSTVEAILNAEGHAAAGLLDPHREPEEAVRDRGRAGLLVRDPEPGALPRQRLQAARLRLAWRSGRSPSRSRRSRSSGCRRSSRELAEQAARPGAGHRARPGSGKSTTLAAMIDKINRERQGPHHHDRGPDRVHPPAQEAASSTSARSAPTPSRSPPRSSTRCARTPT